jgi:hypothetical protein
MKCIKDQEVSVINKTLLKQKVEVDENGLKGSLTISRVRKYQPYADNIKINGKTPENWEIEILFNGKLKGKLDKLEWFSSEILDRKNVSKIRVNKIIKRKLYNFVETRLLFWGISDFKIKKVIWV